MQNYDYKTLNYNDYTTTRSSSISSSSSTTKEETEKRLLTPDTQKLIREIRQMYHDAIGSYPAVYVCRAIVKQHRARPQSVGAPALVAFCGQDAAPLQTIRETALDD